HRLAGAAHALAVAMSALRRNHASCRAPLRRASSPPISASSQDAPHESTSPASNLARASARTLVLCLPFVRMQYGGAIQTLRCAAPRPFSLRPATETQAL